MTQGREDSVMRRTMADKNHKKSKLKMVCNELKDRIYRRTRKKKGKEMAEKNKRAEKGEKNKNKLKYRKKNNK